jgi:phospholipid/cholesterol/gamma-HCH transport system substrate-binding protein
MKKAIRDHWRDFAAIIGLFVISLAVGGYILTQQRLRFPLIEDAPKRIKAEFSTAQAVTPGQGQTVRVSGVKIGDVGKVELKEGRALVTLEIDPEFKELVREDATALLRPKTALKDMFVENSALMRLGASSMSGKRRRCWVRM